MTVDPRHAAGIQMYAGQSYYFCAVGCKVKFDADRVNNQFTVTKIQKTK